MDVWRGRALLLLLLAGTCATVSIHNTITESVREAENHVEDVYLENALETWLDNFDTYTFMVKQDLDHQPSEHTEEEEEEEGHEEEEEEEEGHEEEEEDEEGGWNAPIAVTLNEHGLLNPHVDYQVTVESLVAEPGSIFLTLSKYENKSQCGVGGVTREDPATATNHVNNNGGRLAIGEEHDETIINFDMQHEANSNHSGESEWNEVSHDYWWARGILGGGGQLSLSFTPPECGCLMLSTYYALPIGNLTLVVGPQAYPSELQTLLCVDQLAPYEESEECAEEASVLDESDDYGEGDEVQVLALRQQNEMESSDSETNGIHVVNGRSTRLDARRHRKQAKRLAKKKKRQQKRQNIRLAGRRQARAEARNTRRQARQEPRNQRQGRNGQGRAGKRAWKRLQKKNKKRQRKNRRRNHLAGVAGQVNGTNSTEGDHENPNATHAQTEERLIYRLLGEDFCTQPGNDTNEAEATEATTEAPEEAEEGEEEEGMRGGRGRGRALRRQMRRQRKEQRRMERRRTECSPGIKFCCKEGVKHKKNILSLNMTAQDPAHGQMCNASDDIVTTFASHKYNITQTNCSQVFRSCCHNFTSEVWDSIRAMKAERRNKRKQRRKTRKQQRKVTRRTKKKTRKANRRQHARQHNAEGEEEAVEN